MRLTISKKMTPKRGSVCVKKAKNTAVGPVGPTKTAEGLIQSFNNIIEYKNYRFLVLRKRELTSPVAYSEVQFYRL